MATLANRTFKSFIKLAPGLFFFCNYWLRSPCMPRKGVSVCVSWGGGGGRGGGGFQIKVTGMFVVNFMKNSVKGTEYLV